MRRLLVIVAVLVLSVTAFVANSPAVSITFTHTGSGSGSIGGVAFGVSDFIITGTGDTDNRQAYSNGFWIDHDSASIAIFGVGTFSFTTATRTFFNDFYNTPGFSRAGTSGLDLFNGPTTVLLDGWDMQSSIGPFAGTLTLLQWENSQVITDGGQLLFTSGSAPGTFKAVVRGSVPDASSTVLLLGCALAGLGGLRRKLSS